MFWNIKEYSYMSSCIPKQVAITDKNTQTKILKHSQFQKQIKYLHALGNRTVTQSENCQLKRLAMFTQNLPWPLEVYLLQG